MRYPPQDTLLATWKCCNFSTHPPELLLLGLLQNVLGGISFRAFSTRKLLFQLGDGCGDSLSQWLEDSLGLFNCRLLESVST